MKKYDVKPSDWQGQLVPTSVASAVVGLSAWELRRGFKAGEYPGLLIGRGDRSRRLRWDVDELREAIRRRMYEGREAG